MKKILLIVTLLVMSFSYVENVSGQDQDWDWNDSYYEYDDYEYHYDYPDGGSDAEGSSSDDFLSSVPFAKLGGLKILSQVNQAIVTISLDKKGDQILGQAIVDLEPFDSKEQLNVQLGERARIGFDFPEDIGTIMYLSGSLRDKEGNKDLFVASPRNFQVEEQGRDSDGTMYYGVPSGARALFFELIGSMEISISGAERVVLYHTNGSILVVRVEEGCFTLSPDILQDDGWDRMEVLLSDGKALFYDNMGQRIESGEGTLSPYAVFDDIVQGYRDYYTGIVDVRVSPHRGHNPIIEVMVPDTGVLNLNLYASSNNMDRIFNPEHVWVGTLDQIRSGQRYEVYSYEERQREGVLQIRREPGTVVYLVLEWHPWDIEDLVWWERYHSSDSNGQG